MWRTGYKMSNRIKSCKEGFSLREFLGKDDSCFNERISLSELRKTEWSPDFEDYQRYRLIMGALRYGRINAPGKKQFDRPVDIIRRIKLYLETRNLEHLVDAANLCMLEFEEGKHPDRHFLSQDNTEHTKELR